MAEGRASEMCPHVSHVLTPLGLSSVLPHAVLDLQQSLPRISHPCTRPASFTQSHQEAPRACRAFSLPPGRVGSAAGESTPLRPFPSHRQCFSDPSSDLTAEPATMWRLCHERACCQCFFSSHQGQECSSLSLSPHPRSSCLRELFEYSDHYWSGFG